MKKCKTLYDYEKVLDDAQNIGALTTILTYAKNSNLIKHDLFLLYKHALALPQHKKNYLYFLIRAKIELRYDDLFDLYKFVLNPCNFFEEGRYLDLYRNIVEHAENSNFDDDFLRKLYQLVLLGSYDYPNENVSLCGLGLLIRVQKELEMELEINKTDLLDESDLIKIYRSAFDKELKDNFKYRGIEDAYKEELDLVQPNNNILSSYVKDWKTILTCAKKFKFNSFNFIDVAMYILKRDQQNDCKNILKCIKNLQLPGNIENCVFAQLLKEVCCQNKHASDYLDILEYAKVELKLSFDDGEMEDISAYIHKKKIKFNFDDYLKQMLKDQCSKNLNQK